MSRLVSKSIQLIGICFLFFIGSSCSQKVNTSTSNPPPITPVTNEVDAWVTNGDQSVLLQKQTTALQFGTAYNIYPKIEIDDSQTFQTVDGFGYTFTGGSAKSIAQLNATQRQALLQDLFSTGTGSISVNYLRISLGASDLSDSAFSYDDVPSGQTDVSLTHFTLGPDTIYLVTLLQQILAINPNIKILACPWSPPVWMKDNNSSVGGSLQTQYYAAYAQYFVRYIQEMTARGIPVTAVTPQNEPLNPNNNPSLSMSATEQTNFIKNNLGPAFQSAGLHTNIIIYDHNCDNTQYPISILADAAAKPYVTGAAFHLYAGDISALSTLHNAYPDKQVYFTEQWTSSTGDFGGDLKWHTKNVIIGSMRNWSKNALEWNLANDGSFGPHTPGGCSQCKGAITVTSNASYTKNVSYYIIAHAAKFVPVGSVRIASGIVGDLQNVAFRTPAGKIILIVENDGSSASLFNIKYNGRWVTTSLNAGSVGTYSF